MKKWLQFSAAIALPLTGLTFGRRIPSLRLRGKNGTSMRVCDALKEKYSDVIIFVKLPAANACSTKQLSLQSCLVEEPTSGSEKSALLYGGFFGGCGLRVSFVDNRADDVIVSTDSSSTMVPSRSLDAGSAALVLIIGFLSDARLALYEKLQPRSSIYVGTNLRMDATHLTGKLTRLSEILHADKFVAMGKSFFHAQGMQSYLKYPTGVLYNPVSEYARVQSRRTVYNQEKFVYVSAPSKALKRSCSVITSLKDIYPATKFVVYRPMYSVNSAIPNECDELIKTKTMILREPEGFHEMMNEVASSFAVLFPGGYMETFGNSHFESNCVGTPVLAEATGALPEILQHPELQLLRIGAADSDYVERILYWRKYGRPEVTCHNDKRLMQTIVPLLEKLL